MTGTADAIVTLFVLLLFACLFYGPWQAVCTDLARQLVFERRDRLFDLAASNRLAFDSEEYRKIRLTLEGMIRFAHSLTWPRLLMILLFRRRTLDRDSTPRIAETIASIKDATVRKQVFDLVAEATTSLVVMMMLKSIFIAPIAFILYLLAICSSGLRRLLKPSSVPKNWSEAIEEEARFA
jgi:hypothetical protein